MSFVSSKSSYSGDRSSGRHESFTTNSSSVSGSRTHQHVVARPRMESLFVGIWSTIGYVFGSPLGPVVVSVPSAFRPSTMVHWMLSSRPSMASSVDDSPATSRMRVAGCSWMSKGGVI